MNRDVIGNGEVRDDAITPVEELNYEQARDELLETVSILERGEMNLDEALRYWERGEALAARCEEHLAGAKQRVEQALAASRPDQSTDTQPAE
ncbi:exodeoxyribonuclease VII small subunit [Corynebacterium choanae]|uniref:Exodeoxyribonuclease 7 small subunit n=1 Tax=Corynebacterium choanae TaxID=1862358 RepID=A0A3G6J9Q9_9CORY|nr:exodeoxyribonuclease VII small subunit [Corynebacterium choanae]AZA13180.1 exodeoxyribonuclease VII small subunit [Corynebacterium choanae]